MAFGGANVIRNSVRLADTVQTSVQLATTPARLEKIRVLADYLRGLAPPEIAIAIHYLSGNLPQGRIGIGDALLGALRDTAPAPSATLTLREVDAAFAHLARATGVGSATARKAALATLFARATAAEQDFLRAWSAASCVRVRWKA